MTVFMINVKQMCSFICPTRLRHFSATFLGFCVAFGLISVFSVTKWDLGSCVAVGETFDYGLQLARSASDSSRQNGDRKTKIELVPKQLEV